MASTTYAQTCVAARVHGLVDEAEFAALVKHFDPGNHNTEALFERLAANVGYTEQGKLKTAEALARLRAEFAQAQKKIAKAIPPKAAPAKKTTKKASSKKKVIVDDPDPQPQAEVKEETTETTPEPEPETPTRRGRWGRRSQS